MRLAVCLITCGREAETALTLTSFSSHNAGADVLKLHADEHGQLPHNAEMAKAHGFELIWQPRRRLGALAAMRYSWRVAVERGATHILHLENDQEFVAPLPPVFEDVECIRLYGALKMRGGGPRSKTGPFIMGTKTRIEWKPWRPGWERGLAHWGGQASITRADILWPAINRVDTFKALSLELNSVDTVRPLSNITWHTCEKTTKGGIF